MTTCTVLPHSQYVFVSLKLSFSDPQRLRTDAELISILQRAWLLPREGVTDPTAESKFSLDSKVGDEGWFVSKMETDEC